MFDRNVTLIVSFFLHTATASLLALLQDDKSLEKETIKE
jgi:hypothetical protein